MIAQGLLEVHLFGVPALRLDGQVLLLPTKRAWGLVAFLALEGATSRDNLAKLLWDEAFFENPRKNLRQELYRLMQTPLAQFLEIANDLVRLQCSSDAAQARADETYLISGVFLERFDVPQAPDFQSWLQMQRETFSRSRISRLETRAKHVTGLVALDAWLEVLKADNLHETAVQAALQLEAEHLGKTAALERYRGFKTLLQAELGLEPLPETRALAHQLGLEAKAVVQPKTDVRMQRLLEAAGLFNQPFEAQMLLDVTGLTDFEILEVLEIAATKGFLRRSGTQYTILEKNNTLSTERKRILERRIAKRLLALGAMPEIVAAHLEQAGEHLEATGKYLEAAELANRQDRMTEAMQFYNKVIQLSQTPEQRFEVLQSRVILARRLDNRIWRETIRDLEREARNRTAEHRVIADLQRALWHLTNAEYDKALEFVSAHLERTGQQGAMAAYLQGTILVKTGQLASAEKFLQRALENKSALEDIQNAEVHNVLCVLAVQRADFHNAKIHNQASLKGFARSGHNSGLTRALSTAGALEMLTGQHRAAERMFKRSLETAQKIGDYASQIATLLNLSKTCFETSRFDASHECLEQGLALLEIHSDPNIMGSYLVNMAAIERIQLHLDSAWQRVTTALELAKTQNAMPKVASRSLVLVSMAIERNRFERAQQYLELAAEHITPEIQSELILQKAHLALLRQQPWQTIDLLTDQTLQNDDLEFQSALMAFAYLALEQPSAAKTILNLTASSVYAPYVQAAQIQTHATLGTLQPEHFVLVPSKNTLPFTRYALNLAFAKHSSEQQKYTKELQWLEKKLK